MRVLANEAQAKPVRRLRTEARGLGLRLGPGRKKRGPGPGLALDPGRRGLDARAWGALSPSQKKKRRGVWGGA